jgi:aminoglycoside phosphotransferase (APT) family kinase protein
MDADPKRRVEMSARQALEDVEASITAAVRHHLGCQVETLVAVPTYTDTIVYKVQAPDASLIFKAADPLGHDPSRIAMEAWACTRAREAGVPAPRILAVDTTAALFPTSYLLMASMAGQPLQSCGLTSEQQRPYLRQTGRLLRLVHTITLHGYGSLDDGLFLRTGQVHGEAGTWRGAIVKGVEEGLEYHQRHRLLDATTVGTIRRLMLDYDAVLTAETDSRLLHGDLGANHVYVDPARAEVVGLIDFGSRWAGDPVWDLATYEWGGGLPLEYLLEGYAADRAMRQTFPLKFALYCVCQVIPWAKWCHERGYSTHTIAVLNHVIALTQERLGRL